MEISQKVATLLTEENIPQTELEYMVKHAAICSLASGFNRRYHHWLFCVANGAVVDMRDEVMVEIGRGESRMLEDHDNCDGKGCRTCRWVGQVYRRVTDIKIPTYARQR
jgi:hypothetical protein